MTDGDAALVAARDTPLQFRRRDAQIVAGSADSGRGLATLGLVLAPKATSIQSGRLAFDRATLDVRLFGQDWSISNTKPVVAANDVLKVSFSPPTKPTAHASPARIEVTARAEGLTVDLQSFAAALARPSTTLGGLAIPVMVVDAATVQDRALAFIGHNRDRVAMTPMQLYYASLAAKEVVAVAMADACSRANVSIRKFPPANGIYQEGETVAVRAIETIVARKGAPGGARVLKVLRDAGRAPISAQEIKAVAVLLFEPEWRDAVDAVDLATVIRSKPPETWAGNAEAKVRRGKTMSLWRAIAIVWFQSLPKKRKAGE